MTKNTKPQPVALGRTRAQKVSVTEQKATRFMTPTHLDITRKSRRPTTSFSPIDERRIQEVILGVFRRHQVNAMDMEALIFYALQAFDVHPDTYEIMFKSVKAHILKHFAIHQGSNLRLSEVMMRRITVCHTIEKDQE